MLIDSHAHLDDPRFAEDFDAVLDRAVAAGVERILAVATTADSSEATLALASRYPMLAASVGIHPNHVNEAAGGDWDRIVVLANQGRAVALGETGLDRHWDFTPFPMQQDYFARHLALARTTGLPVIIHAREAETDILALVREDFERHGPVRGVLHSWTGTAEAAAAGVAMGLHVSFAGMLTYKNADDLRAVAASVPVDRLLVETDCPYLVPVPQRGRLKRNEPSLVIHTAECLAAVKGMTLQELSRHVTDNTNRLFSLK
jgi:TatD DNase family protein